MFNAGQGPASPFAVPNLITLARLLLVPVFVWMLVADGGQDGALRWVAAVIFITGIATDSLDGYLARSRDLVTDLGKLLDPIADKALTGAAFVTLSVLGELPWWVTIVILVREIGITVWRLVEARRVVLPAGRGGKAKTLMQAIALSAALLPLWSLVGEPMHWINTALMAIAFVLTVVSGADYLWQAYRPRRATKGNS
ncbi:CDP-diacylglycerol--glycerol-3-phosphate 3-phosphatidyltransferase [Pseudoclavibacter endophyticus]|nr:CDP-diacylglycerol--glycerol-3-phosphate 3-phosphatidyltransferase [Pseudoclavibacter endophyticus]